MRKNNYINLVFSIFLGCHFYAQEVNLEITGNREIELAYRISKQPKLIDTVIPYSEIQYPLLTLKYDTRFTLDTLQAAKIKLLENLKDLFPAYIKVGIGSKFMPLAEIYYNSTRSRKLLYGVHFKHLSSLGGMKGYAPTQYDRTNLNLAASLNESKYNLDGKIHFSSFGMHQYGSLNQNTPKDSISQRFSDVGTSFLYRKQEKDSSAFNYNVGFKYNYFQDKAPHILGNKIDSLSKWLGRENYIELNGKVWRKLKKEIVSADVALNLNSYKYGSLGNNLSLIDTALVTTNLIFKANPNITTYAKNNRLKLKFGVGLALSIVDKNLSSKSGFNVYPDIEAKYSLFNDILIPYLEVKGGLQQTTFKSLSRENEFLLSNVILENENNQINTNLGIKGTLSKTIMFNVNARFSLVKNKALFVTDTLYARGNQFRVVYDDIQMTTIQGSLIYQSSEKLKIEGVGVFNSYLTKNYIYAWNLPQIQLIGRAFYQVLPNLNVQLDMNLEGGRFAQVYTKEESDKEENLQFAKKLGFITDFNLGAEYLYSNRMSAFLQFNNFVAQRYKRWYNYPVQGFQVMGGVAFKF